MGVGGSVVIGGTGWVYTHGKGRVEGEWGFCGGMWDVLLEVGGML